MFPDASARSFPASSPSFSSLPPRSPASGHQSQLDEADRRWDEIRRNRSLPRRPYSAASSASTVRPPAQLPAELDDALEELARRARELQERERRLDDDEFRVRENAAAQAQWLADQTDRLGEEEDRLWQAAEDEIAAAYHNIGRGGHEGGALQPYDGASQLSDQDEPSRVYGHPANERDVYRRPLPPPEPLDLPTAVHDHGGPLPPDFDRRTGPSQPYPEDIYYPRHGYARPAFPGARPPLTQTFYPGASRSAFDVQAGYGPSSARSRPGFFGSLFPRRQDTSYGVSSSSSCVCPALHRHPLTRSPYALASSTRPRAPAASTLPRLPTAAARRGWAATRPSAVALTGGTRACVPPSLALAQLRRI